MLPDWLSLRKTRRLVLTISSSRGSKILPHALRVAYDVFPLHANRAAPARSAFDGRPEQAIVESIKINRPRFWQISRMGWCVISIRLRKAPAAVSGLFARLEQAFAHFAQVPYHDARTLRELEQVSDDLPDWPEETPPRR
jgi:hypothetical protein